MERNSLIRLLHWLSRRFDRYKYLRALGQAPDQVVVRGSGERFLGPPRPIGPFAAEHWQFAWLADSAYGKTHAGKTSKAETARLTEDPEAAMTRTGWTKWQNDNFLSDELRKRFDAYHLRVEVWERQSSPAVAVTFGGTMFRNKMDWLANFRWFMPGHVDEYTLTQIQFAKAFAGQCIKRNHLGQPVSAHLYSTGHSLGGGLAQQFAYALPDNPNVPRVEKVYAFDPSPVTGFFSVDKKVRDSNRPSLKIDRIYERGEILAIARSLTSLFWKPPAAAPAIRGVRYNLIYTCNPLAGHSMKMLAGKLQAAAVNIGRELP
jgi:Lipase (class 3)